MPTVPLLSWDGTGVTQAAGQIVYTQTTTGQPWVLAPGNVEDGIRPRKFMGPDAPESTFPSYAARNGDEHLDVA